VVRPSTGQLFEPVDRHVIEFRGVGVGYDSQGGS
jgi:hypothetical protein